MLPWDGTYLGEYDKSIIRAKKKTDTGKYWSLQLEHKFITVGFVCLKRDQASLYNLMDELKPFFGLQKVGTHRLIIGERLFCIYRLPEANGNIYLSDVVTKEMATTLPDELKRQIQDILLFRELMGLSRITERYIHIHPLHNYAFSVDERSQNRASLAHNVMIMSQALIKRWFPTNIPEKFRLTPVWLMKDKFNLSRLRSDLHATILRVDPVLAPLASHLYARTYTLLHIK